MGVETVDPKTRQRMDRIVERLNELTNERNDLMLETRQAGTSLREIAAHAGMTHVGVKKLLARTIDRKRLEEERTENIHQSTTDH